MATTTTTYNLTDVSTHNTITDLWIIISGSVYNVTEFQKKHPGGAKILKAVAGKDATKKFKKTHNPLILGTEQYKDLKIGEVKEEKEEEKKTFGLGRLFGRKKEKDSGGIGGANSTEEKNEEASGT